MRLDHKTQGTETAAQRKGKRKALRSIDSRSSDLCVCWKNTRCRFLFYFSTRFFDRHYEEAFFLIAISIVINNRHPGEWPGPPLGFVVLLRNSFQSTAYMAKRNISLKSIIPQQLMSHPSSPSMFDDTLSPFSCPSGISSQPPQTTPCFSLSTSAAPTHLPIHPLFYFFSKTTRPAGSPVDEGAEARNPPPVLFVL